MKKTAIIGTILIAILLIGCDDKPKSKLGHNENTAISKKNGSKIDVQGKEIHNEEKDIVEISKQQLETIGLEMKPLEQRTLGNNIKVTGTLELFPQDKANISPFVGGNVSSINVIEGDKVNKGQVLAYLEHPDIISMQQTFQEKNEELIFLKQDYERKQTLFDSDVSSAKDFQMAQSKFRTTTSSVNALKSKLRLLGFNTDKIANGELFLAVPITSPISGFVDDVMINLGDYVAPQTKIFTVSDNSKIHVDFKVYEKDISKAKKGQQIYFTVASQPNKILTAKINSLGKTFETAPKALHLHADIEHKIGNLLPGMYVEGRIVEGEKKGYAVPEEAIIKDGEQAFIFILDEDDKKEENKMKFKKIPVSTGITDLGFVEINLPSDVKKNVKIVTRGAYTLASEMIKDELGHDD